MAQRVKIQLRRSFSEHMKDSTNRAWDVIWRSTREKRLSEIEAREACDWLRAAGFPQYAQLFRDCHFPIDIDWVKADHDFLDKDAIDSLCRRLVTLNKCVETNLETSRSKRRSEESEDEEPCAISPKWTFSQKTRHWNRTETLESQLLMDRPHLLKSESQDASIDEDERHEVCSTHSSSSLESDGGSTDVHNTGDDLQTSQSSLSCSSTCKTMLLDTSFSSPPSPREMPCLSGEEHYLNKKMPRKKGQSLLKKMEKFRLRGSTSMRSPNRGRPKLLISGPVLQEGLSEERLKQLNCLDIAELQDEFGSPPSSSTPSGSNSSPSESSSTVSTPSPVTRVRGKSRKYDPWNQGLESSQISQYKNRKNQHNDVVFEVPHGYKPGTFPTALGHGNVDTSVNWRTGSFHGYSGRQGHGNAAKDHESLPCSPLASFDHRVSFYDNVPGDQLSEGGVSETLLASDDDMFHALDCVMERINGLQQLVTNWAEKLSEDGDSDFTNSSSCPSPPCLKDVHLDIGEAGHASSEADKLHGGLELSQQPRLRQLHWSGEQTLSLPTPGSGMEGQPASQVNRLRRLSLLRLTALMDKHSPSCKQGWNWTVPKVYRKMKRSDQKSHKVFGVPLLQSVQRAGKPLPPSILRAMQYLKTQCLDQVGLFRKSGVKPRIQYLRDMVEAYPDGVSFEGQSAFDVADMVKQYFRDLPEPIFSAKLCETFLHIYQYFPKDQQFLAAQAAIFLLPDENREALQTLLLFLEDVVACVDENQMTPTNIAVCLAPSIYHLNTQWRDSHAASRSSHRKYSLGRPDQRDLSETLAATQGLAHMVAEASRLFQMPDYCYPCEELQTSEERPGMEEVHELRASLEASAQQLMRDGREKTKAWVVCASTDHHVDLAYKKVEDNQALRLWRGAVEVDAPQQELLQRVLREPDLWQADLQGSRVLETLDQHADIYQYTLQRAGSRPPLEHVLLRTWHSDPSVGPVFVAATSVDHPDAPHNGLRAHVHISLFLVEPVGVRRSRLTHFCRTDTRGRSSEWHNKVCGHLLTSALLRIRDSFKAKPKESKM
ncbi:rho GTPase-activating protein 7 isoform X1 [Denticeps clupeoides]|uniref:rho GTPase-activating protein 7 isoform X1 n=1 Tax=Denticeps clupeoides TaxID=299321 RepID=UPI0010A2E379|nr:rho GTPase-activating protein 7-like isoform X1 [Denticeps clupeoides]